MMYQPLRERMPSLRGMGPVTRSSLDGAAEVVAEDEAVGEGLLLAVEVVFHLEVGCGEGEAVGVIADVEGRGGDAVVAVAQVGDVDRVGAEHVAAVDGEQRGLVDEGGVVGVLEAQQGGGDDCQAIVAEDKRVCVRLDGRGRQRGKQAREGKQPG